MSSAQAQCFLLASACVLPKGPSAVVSGFTSTPWVRVVLGVVRAWGEGEGVKAVSWLLYMSVYT